MSNDSDLLRFLLEQTDNDQQLARALALDAQAKRVIIERYQDYATRAHEAVDRAERQRLEAVADALHWVLKVLVQTYTDRVGFRSKWKWKGR